ncbi:ABC transporter permease [Williamsia sp.]|uniref:ABC transporter permease n=1 Tax=Williamsia sp. TaxID=1872085 RepID=UPI002F93383C
MTTTASGTTVTKTPTTFTAGKPDLVRESLVMVRRNLIHTKRQPEMLSDVTVQPIMFVLLFAYVFGASINPGSGFDYKEWLLPGIMGQTIAFSAFIVALGLTNDLEKGIIDRFRSLPMAKWSVLVGRSVAALIHSSIGIVVMALTGLLIGWRIHEGVPKAILAFALVLLFGFAMIWFGILIGSVMKTPEAVNGVMFTLLFPITFLSNAFVPTAPMPGWLQAIAEWNPISSLVQSMRELWGNGPAAPADAPWPLQNPELSTVLWSIGLTLVFAPFALRAYRKRTTD